MVRLAATSSWLGTSKRIEAMPVPKRSAATNTSMAHPTMTRPAAVIVEPRTERMISSTPICASRERIRAETAC